jgi:hypothetical protein
MVPAIIGPIALRQEVGIEPVGGKMIGASLAGAEEIGKVVECDAEDPRGGAEVADENTDDSVTVL